VVDKEYYENIKFYVTLYKFFKQKANGRNYLPYNCIRDILHRNLHSFPRVLQYTYLKEMEFHKLIKRNGNSREIIYELIGGDIDNIIRNDLDI
jgi:hypothetical protein